MNFQIRKKIIIITIFQLCIIAFSFIFYHKISLLSYINISFYISAALLLTSLLVYTVHSGFFDVIFRSFSLAFSRGDAKRKWDDIPALSELVSVNNRPLLFYGLVNSVLMLIALFIYFRNLA